MRFAWVLARIGGVEGSVGEEVSVDADGAVVLHARPRARRASCCGVCGRRSPGYERGVGRRRWRALDLGVVRCFVEADASHTRAFEDVAGWLSTQTSTSVITRLMRVSWPAVGQIIARVVGEFQTRRGEQLDGCGGSPSRS